MTGPANGWLRGVIKEVPSGDTVVITGAVKSGIPPEKRLTLSSLLAPKLGRRDGSTSDDAFAWHSREYLRKLAVGKPCVFRVDYKLDSVGGKEFGTVFLNGEENISLLSVSNGWSRVREGGAQQSPFYNELLAAQEKAKSQHLGVHNSKPEALTSAIRSLPEDDYGKQLLEKHGKGATVAAVVDSAISGSMLRVSLLPEGTPITVMLAGVQCPSMGKRVQAGEESDPNHPQESTPEPFAREAKYFAERKCLNKEIILVMQGVSQFGVLIVSIRLHNNAISKPTEEYEDLGDSIITAGLGKAAEWSLNMMATGAFKLRERERTARASRVGIWHNHVPQTGNSAKLEDNFSGHVSEIVSGDCVIVTDKMNGAERRVLLSSIRAPRAATKERAAEPWGVEAKEFLRHRLIGKPVSVRMDYTKKIPVSGAAAPKHEERSMAFGTIQILEKTKEGEQKMNNVAELLLVRGLAQTVRHRGDEERSAHFESLVNAEEVGKRGKKGIWSSKEAPVTRINDLTIPGSASKARQHLPFLQRSGKLAGVCDYVLSGSRLKIYIPKESVSIAFSPSGVRCPSKEEDFSAEAIAFTRSQILQRDIEVMVDGIDKVGTFLGSLTFSSSGQKIDLGVALLEAGLAKLHPMTNIDALHNGKDLQIAEEKAKKKKMNVWSKVESTVETPISKANETEKFDRQKASVIITEMKDANSFYVQFSTEARGQWIADQLAEICLDDEPMPKANLRKRELCLAKFSTDNCWYRARVEEAYLTDPTMPKYDIIFIDFGNRARVDNRSIRDIPSTLAAVPPQAHLATLAFVHSPVEVQDDLDIVVMERLADLTQHGRKVLNGFIELKSEISSHQNGKAWGTKREPQNGNQESIIHLTLMSDESQDVSNSINATMVKEGLAKVVACKGINCMSEAAKFVYDELILSEKIARQNHVGLWRYGDIDDEDEDDFPSLR